MKKLLIATTNKGKLKEIAEFLKGINVELVSLKDVGITQNVEENGISYEENSQKKALFYAKLAGLPAIADDGGLEINALGGAPGLKSRRWLGYEGTDEELLAHMQKVADNLPEQNRDASFVTVLSFALPTGEVWSERGEVNGIIAKERHPKVLHGYPYRSFFYIPEIKKFYHENEFSREEMKEFNHRYKAIQKLKVVIKEKLHLLEKQES